MAWHAITIQDYAADYFKWKYNDAIHWNSIWNQHVVEANSSVLLTGNSRLTFSMVLTEDQLIQWKHEAEIFLAILKALKSSSIHDSQN